MEFLTYAKSNKKTNPATTSKAAKPSVETQQAATTIANGIKKPGQSKEQTKLIEQGIQKGIELYKKQHKAKAREADKAKKKLKNKATPSAQLQPQSVGDNSAKQNILPWVLLVASWAIFAAYLVL
ncbi:DUF2956 domain-containing protein [Thalassomonas sp. M1454]|uniref:DUF2956 domain-containing protein n=1 Tax=Thalassomonas sp. M1454 TaxID=2594477 RepID=UPI001180B39D|nr:DUF2956 domain-containing protein [Thalassomonas sp. M1454]TRX55925.1 DUF2956 domain-containing protein [Thalassomonas sp. M1454]